MVVSNKIMCDRCGGINDSESLDCKYCGVRIIERETIKLKGYEMEPEDVQDRIKKTLESVDEQHDKKPTSFITIIVILIIALIGAVFIVQRDDSGDNDFENIYESDFAQTINDDCEVVEIPKIEIDYSTFDTSYNDDLMGSMLFEQKIISTSSFYNGEIIKVLEYIKASDENKMDVVLFLEHIPTEHGGKASGSFGTIHLVDNESVVTEQKYDVTINCVVDEDCVDKVMFMKKYTSGQNVLKHTDIQLESNRFYGYKIYEGDEFTCFLYVCNPSKNKFITYKIASSDENIDPIQSFVIKKMVIGPGY